MKRLEIGRMESLYIFKINMLGLLVGFGEKVSKGEEFGIYE